MGDLERPRTALWPLWPTVLSIFKPKTVAFGAYHFKPAEARPILSATKNVAQHFCF